MVCHRVQFLALLFSQSTYDLLVSLPGGFELAITSMLLYLSLDIGNESKDPSSLENLEHCIADNRLCMTQNLLKLNEGKTDTIYLSSSYNAKSQRKTQALQIGESVRDLGFNFAT